MRLCCTITILASPLWAALPADQRDFFESKIRPVLAQDCYECHSAAGKKKGGLLLDSRPGWQAGGDSGDAIVPGDPSKSLLIQAIRHDHDDLKMPKAGAKLTDAVIADFEKWINLGAPDPRETPPTKEELAKVTDWKNVLARRKQESWAFQPVRNSPVPKIRSRRGGEAQTLSSSGSVIGEKLLPPHVVSYDHPVDRFILAKIEDAGLQFAKRADPAAIIRRLSCVITGLPPTLDEIQKSQITNDKSQIESYVDKLLQSPRFGEKWARHWMDWVRYAETYGSEGDPAIPYAWRYRDYLIRALNADVPYPQLVREAIAGDLLPQPRINRELGINESALGIGQLRMVLHGFSPTDSLDEMVSFTDNQIDVVSKAFQGLTLSCARCHNHKFDAISQADFYSWFGIFSSTHPAIIDANVRDIDRPQREELKGIKRQIQELVGRAWLAAAEKLPRIEPKPGEAASIHPSQHWDLRKDRWFADGAGVRQGATRAGEFSMAPEGDKVIAHIHPAGVFSDLISTRDRAVLNSPRFKCEGGTLWVRAAGSGGARCRYIVQNYPRTGTIHKAKELKDAGDAALGWRQLDLEYWKGDDVFIQCTTAADMAAEAKLDQRSWFGITEAMITPVGQAPPSPAVGGDPHEAVLAWVQGHASDGQAELLDALLRDGKLPNDERGLPGVASLLARYREIESHLPEATRAPGVLEADARDAALFTRGDHKQPADPVPRRFLDAIDATPYHAANSGRLQLAESLVREDNPLTARVMANRIWHHVFGRGIVATPDNFGKLGEPPTHPELLDYLARRFTESGGSIKEMIRFLVTSETFQLDEHAPPGAAERDPENKLWTHWGLRRLEAEAVRDSMIALSGKLDLEMGGEGVGGGEARRSVYVRVIRNALDPLLTTFDAPVPSSARGRRDATNVPAQSLALLNDRNVVRWAEAWSRRILADTALLDDRARLRRMFAEALGRPPRDSELSASLAFLGQAASAGEAARRELAEAGARVQSLQRDIDSILLPARQRLEDRAKARTTDAAAIRSAPEPFAEWDFKVGGEDLKGGHNLSLEGSARIEGGALVLDGGKSYAKSAPLKKTLHEKTLEAWVMLANLEQRGGGVMTVQDDHGVVFDSIVFAEKEPGCWVAGSNNFRRSKLLEAPREQEAAGRVVHVAVVYGADGTVTAYRDGKLHGRPYQSEGPAEFEAGKSEILFGLRHGTGPGGNRMLQGRVYRARLYDRALGAEEIASTSRLESSVITEAEVMGSLSAAGRERAEDLRAQLEAAQARRAQLGEQESASGPEAGWRSLAQSLFNLKEFIYLR